MRASFTGLILVAAALSGGAAPAAAAGGALAVDAGATPSTLPAMTDAAGVLRAPTPAFAGALERREMERGGGGEEARSRRGQLPHGARAHPEAFFLMAPAAPSLFFPLTHTRPLPPFISSQATASSCGAATTGRGAAAAGAFFG